MWSRAHWSRLQNEPAYIPGHPPIRSASSLAWLACASESPEGRPLHDCISWALCVVYGLTGASRTMDNEHRRQVLETESRPARKATIVILESWGTPHFGHTLASILLLHFSLFTFRLCSRCCSPLLVHLACSCNSKVAPELCWIWWLAASEKEATKKSVQKWSPRRAEKSKDRGEKIRSSLVR